MNTHPNITLTAGETALVEALGASANPAAAVTAEKIRARGLPTRRRHDSGDRQGVIRGEAPPRLQVFHVQLQLVTRATMVPGRTGSGPGWCSERTSPGKS